MYVCVCELMKRTDNLYPKQNKFWREWHSKNFHIKVGGSIHLVLVT